MASRSVNKVILLGNLGKDAETKFTASGISVSKFSLATGRRQKDAQTGEWKDITDWHNIVMWKTENVANYLLKGKQIYLEAGSRPAVMRTRKTRRSTSPKWSATPTAWCFSAEAAAKAALPAAIRTAWSRCLAQPAARNPRPPRPTT